MNDSVYWHGRTYSSKQVDVLINNNFKNISSEKHKSISKKGGIASGIARRKKREEQEHCKKMFYKAMRLSGFMEDELRDFEKWQKYVKNKTEKLC